MPEAVIVLWTVIVLLAVVIIGGFLHYQAAVFNLRDDRDDAYRDSDDSDARATLAEHRATLAEARAEDLEQAVASLTGQLADLHGATAELRRELDTAVTQRDVARRGRAYFNAVLREESAELTCYRTACVCPEAKDLVDTLHARRRTNASTELADARTILAVVTDKAGR